MVFTVNERIKALLLALFIQLCIAALLFIGGLLDPLLGLLVAGIYFFIIGFYLMYRYLLIFFRASGAEVKIRSKIG